MKLLSKWQPFLTALLMLFPICLVIAFQNCENKVPRYPSLSRTPTSKQTSETNTQTTTTSTRQADRTQLQIPKRAGRLISDCQQNPQYNACIYKKNPISQKASPINMNTEREDILRQMSLLQNYAVQITDTSNGLLKNSHFNVTIKSKSNDKTRLSLTNPNDKWTTPYNYFDFSVEQVMTYHWLMYQRDWMILNTSTWYASNKKIKIEINDGSEFCAYWSPRENKIALCGVSTALSAEISSHEAGHANFYHSSPQRINSASEICATHVRCSDRKSLCRLSQKELEDSSLTRCCISKQGCFFAINEGQSDFHAAVLFPNNPQIGETISNQTEGITGCYPDDGPSRNPQEHANSIADQIYKSCQDRFKGKGEIHVMGIIYNSIWWEIYNHTDTSKKDIVNLFTEHLPLITYGDTFKTAGNKMINLAKQIFGSEEDSKGLRYANIVREEFLRVGITL